MENRNLRFEMTGDLFKTLHILHILDKDINLVLTPAIEDYYRHDHINNFNGFSGWEIYADKQKENFYLTNNEGDSYDEWLWLHGNKKEINSFLRSAYMEQVKNELLELLRNNGGLALECAIEINKHLDYFEETEREASDRADEIVDMLIDYSYQFSAPEDVSYLLNKYNNLREEL